MVEVIPGQASDAPRLEPMLDKTLDRVPVIDELDAGKRFDGDQQRHAYTARGVFANIPNKKNRVHPWAFDPVGSRTEPGRTSGKTKQFRRVATRYEKLAPTFLGLIQLILGFINVKYKDNQKVRII
ncbi:transposase [Fimbriiglobus ruber]|uniref:Mobile element protein n=1 Tax=Fimbriiglobus ruber TaxID=1908690 RepID=A0A225DH86_9BACT|nr:transposase [Fimbriiglobus ruber]OWK40860.1 Mobile element protein [Fimbriiglobus ruber]